LALIAREDVEVAMLLDVVHRGADAQRFLIERRPRRQALRLATKRLRQKAHCGFHSRSILRIPFMLRCAAAGTAARANSCPGSMENPAVGSTNGAASQLSRGTTPHDGTKPHLPARNIR